MARSVNYSNSLDALRAAGDLFNYVHADYRYYKPDWDMIRDAMAGERRVKSLGETYLPRLGVNAGTTYDAYKQRAVFVNMTARTVSGLVGTIFRRRPKKIGFPEKQTKLTASIAPDGAPIEMFAKTVVNEVTQVGRVGLLVDMDANGVNPPYLTYYVAENILSWKTEMIDGRETLTYVLLREIIDDMKFLGLAGSTAPADAPMLPIKVGSRQTRVAGPAKYFDSGETPVLRAQYRVLALEDGKYVQKTYSTVMTKGVETLGEPSVVQPTRNGAPLDFIPFMIVGTNGVSAKVTKSPMYDITTLNMSHYRSSAQLEHGRYFTALPIYYVPIKAGQEGGEYTIGPSVVWEVPTGEKPGILEYYGTGLRELANSLSEKESHISQLGGRIMGISRDAASQSPEVAALTQANELSVLTNICDACTDALTRACRWWAWWQNVDDKIVAEMKFLLNRDFATSNVGAREMRAIVVLYQSGVLPVEELHRVFQEAELLSEDTTVEDFIAMLENPASFPGQPNWEAMQEGFPDAAGRNQYNIAKLGAKTELQTIDKQGKVDEAQQRADQKHQQLIQQRAHDQTMQQNEATSEQTRKTQQLEQRSAPKGKKPLDKKTK